MKRLILIILTICILTSSFVVVHADDVQEQYLSDLRIIYADSYNDAVKTLKNTEFEDYKVLNINLNKDTGKTGVWLAYKTTTDVDDAITDLSVMQMSGGYRDGNYQEMLQQSFDEYVKMGEIYLDAISYFIDAYYAGSFFAECAYRQLNFYYDEDSGKTLGVLFEEGIGADALATMFLEGNSYALANIRSILAQGVSYNEDGKSFLEHVMMAVEEADGDPSSLEDEEYDELALLISGSLQTYREMFKEYETIAPELNYDDDEVTDDELKHAETDAIASIFKDITYLSGQSLYDFCLEFELNEDDLSNIYPLIAAMNKGQIAMTKVGHFYDVVRYSFSVLPEEMMEEDLAELEAQYGENPFNIFTGVDRSIYDGTFALTSEAYRSDAASKESLLGYLLNEDTVLRRSLETAGFSLGLGAVIFGKIYANYVKNGVETARQQAAEATRTAMEQFSSAITKRENLLLDNLQFSGVNLDPDMALEFMTTYDTYLKDAFAESGSLWFKGSPEQFAATPFHEKVMTFVNYYRVQNVAPHHHNTAEAFGYLNDEVTIIQQNRFVGDHGPVAVKATYSGMQYLSSVMYIVGGVMMLASAISLLVSVISYYNPGYEDIPADMVNLLDTADGDRYIKYDAVTMIDMNDDGKYDPADLNAFDAKRWNALYYTKSYEAGKPLLADFKVSYDNNVAGENYLPVHRFGEEVCYDLNKYNFDSDSANIYLSVKQSDEQKSAIADLPPVVGTMEQNGYIFVSAGCGLLVGAGMALGVQKIIEKKKRPKTEA